MVPVVDMKQTWELSRCIVCSEPAGAVLVVEDREVEMRIAVCQVHGFEMANIRIRMERSPSYHVKDTP